MDNILPNHKLLSRTELDNKKRRTPLVKKSSLCKKKHTKPNALLQKKKQTNPPFKTITKLHSNIKVFILQTYSGD